MNTIGFKTLLVKETRRFLKVPGQTIAQPVITTALYFLVFLTGGPGHVVVLGLLVAGVAVPSLILGLLPKTVAWAGLVIAAIAEVTALVLVWPPLMVLLPVARVPALVWLIVAGAMLPLQRRRLAAS